MGWMELSETLKPALRVVFQTIYVSSDIIHNAWNCKFKQQLDSQILLQLSVAELKIKSQNMLFVHAL